MIRFDHVTKRYKSNIGLDDVSVHIKKGDFVFLVGPSGAGKSTFIKLILKEINADEGSIVVDGQEVTRLSNRQVSLYRRKIGTVFQDFRLLPNKTVFENVAFAMEVLHRTPRQIRKQVPQILSLVGISDKAHKFPEELSAGEQQRVAIARAIVNNPSLLIADEPTGNLDPDTAWEIMDLLDQINLRGTTVLMVTHAKDIVDRMQRRVIAIRAGRVIRDEEGNYRWDGDMEDGLEAETGYTAQQNPNDADYADGAAYAQEAGDISQQNPDEPAYVDDAAFATARGSVTPLYDGAEDPETLVYGHSAAARAALENRDTVAYGAAEVSDAQTAEAQAVPAEAASTDEAPPEWDQALAEDAVSSAETASPAQEAEALEAEDGSLADDRSAGETGEMETDAGTQAAARAADEGEAERTADDAEIAPPGDAAMPDAGGAANVTSIGEGTPPDAAGADDVTAACTPDTSPAQDAPQAAPDGADTMPDVGGEVSPADDAAKSYAAAGTSDADAPAEGGSSVETATAADAMSDDVTAEAPKGADVTAPGSTAGAAEKEAADA